MKSDRELLEMAAKAIGQRVIWYQRGPAACLSYAPADATGTSWNPLADDGDALRLAVRLGMLVDVMLEQKHSHAIGGTIAWPGEGIQTHDGEHDIYASTRRAIVRAAAEIGEVMP